MIRVLHRLTRLLSGVAVLAAFGTGLARAESPQPLPPEGFPERVLGSSEAPITVIEYASLTCSHCATFITQTFPRLKTDFIDTGKVRFIYRDFPLDSIAMAGAIIARSLPEERYFPLIDVLYAQQETWIQAKNPLDAIKQYARLAGMSDTDIEAALNNEALFKAIQAVQDQARDVWQINATPSFVIGDKVVAGALGYDAFAKEINTLLSKD